MEDEFFDMKQVLNPRLLQIKYRFQVYTCSDIRPRNPCFVCLPICWWKNSRRPLFLSCFSVWQFPWTGLRIFISILRTEVMLNTRWQTSETFWWQVIRWLWIQYWKLQLQGNPVWNLWTWNGILAWRNGLSESRQRTFYYSLSTAEKQQSDRGHYGHSRKKDPAIESRIPVSGNEQSCMGWTGREQECYRLRNLSL